VGAAKESQQTVARQNKFARRLQEQQRARHSVEGQGKPGLSREPQPTIDEQLVRLDEDIRKLKIEYDIFFNGAAKRPPFDTKSRVETLVKRLADERAFTYAQRYRYNSLVARYVALRDLWRRNIQEREEGRDPIAAARAARGSSEEKMGRVRQSSFVCADAGGEVETVRGLYDALVEAKRGCGEPVEDLSFAQFHRMIAAKTDALKQRLGCESVRYSIYTEGGRVSVKAKAEK
jgi:hypothetical protein